MRNTMEDNFAKNDIDGEFDNDELDDFDDSDLMDTDEVDGDLFEESRDTDY